MSYCMQEVNKVKELCNKRKRVKIALNPASFSVSFQSSLSFEYQCVPTS